MCVPKTNTETPTQRPKPEPTKQTTKPKPANQKQAELRATKFKVARHKTQNQTKAMPNPETMQAATNLRKQFKPKQTTFKCNQSNNKLKTPTLMPKSA